MENRQPWLVDQPEKFGDRLKVILAMKGMTQSSLVRATGIDQYRMCRYCTGKQLPDLARFGLIVKALNLDPRDLMLSDAQTAEELERS